MSRRHFAEIAWALRQQLLEIRAMSTDPDKTDESAYRARQWETNALALADVCAHFNGGFKYQRFYEACGLDTRPDGSLYPMAAPR